MVVDAGQRRGAGSWVEVSFIQQPPQATLRARRRQSVPPWPPALCYDRPPACTHCETDALIAAIVIVTGRRPSPAQSWDRHHKAPAKLRPAHRQPYRPGSGSGVPGATPPTSPRQTLQAHSLSRRPRSTQRSLQARRRATPSGSPPPHPPAGPASPTPASINPTPARRGKAVQLSAPRTAPAH